MKIRPLSPAAPDEVSFRQAEASDEGRIRELFIEMLCSINGTPDEKGYDEGYLDKFFAGREDRIFVAERGSEVIAYLSVEVYRDGGYIYLDDLSVTESCRSRGIGTALINIAEVYAKEIGIPAIVFHVNRSNARAHSLYLRPGYSDNEDQGSRMRMAKDIGTSNHGGGNAV